ncbi:MAG TPA: hypothetical protein VJG66_02520 [Patescibacteria group bacterium]|nr:hypothetical protein [Patescibacteria group bacterium]
MGLIGIIIAAIVLIIIFTFSYLSNSTSTITPEKSNQMQNEAQEVMDSTTEKAKSDAEQIKIIDAQQLE